MKISRLLAAMLCAAIITGSGAVPAGAANIIEYHHDEKINMTVTPGNGKCGDNLNWNLSKDGTLTVSGNGKMYDYTEYGSAPWFENNSPQAILNVEVEDGVESIACFAFSHTSIVSIILPNSVKEIGEGALSSCLNLEYVYLSDNIEELSDAVLYYDRALTYVHLPEHLKKMGNSAFAWDDKMKNIIIPQIVTEMGESVFAQCFALKKAVVPDGVTKLSRGMFSSCTSITELYLPPSLKLIEKSAISGCPNIDKIIIPDGVTELGISALDWTDEVRNSSTPQIIYIPKSVTTFGKWAIVNRYNVEIHGFAGSEAEKYAKENNIPFVAVTESMYKAEEYQAALNGQTEIIPEMPVQTITAQAKSNTLDVMSTNGNIDIKVNGALLSFPDAQPYIDENGRTQIPIRAVAEDLDCEVDWDNTERVATIRKDNKVIKIAIGNNNMQVGNETIIMDTTAEIKDNRTYIPVRFVGEALGMQVNWVG